MSAEELARQQTAAGTRPAAGGIQRLPTPAGEKYVRPHLRSARPVCCLGRAPADSRGVVAQRVGEKLGHGAFGEVIQAMREDTQEMVAVKQIPIKVDDDRHQDKIMVRSRHTTWGWVTSVDATGVANSGRSAC